MKKLLTGFCLVAVFVFVSANVYAQVDVSSFTYFQNLTTGADGYDISLTSNIVFTSNLGNSFSGTIRGNGYSLNGNNTFSGLKIRGTAATKDILFDGDITFVNFLNSVGSYGTAAQGGGLFIAGSAQQTTGGTAGTGTSMLTFSEGTVNFINDRALSSAYGAISQGGGLFAAGSASSNKNGAGSNISAGGITAIAFTSSTVNFTSSSATSGTYGTISQGGGLFAGGSVSGGAYSDGINISDGGTATISFTSSTVNFTGNSSASAGGSLVAAAQGGGLFVGGSVSGGAYGTGVNISSNGTATVNFIDSNINIAGNIAGTGGGIFAAGSLAAGTAASSASGGEAVINFINSTVNFTGNTANLLGGAIYIDGNYASDGATAENGTAVIKFASSTVSFTSNTANNGGAIYAVNGSSIVFDNTSVEFLWNNSKAGNGVVYWDETSYMGLRSADITRAVGNTANNGGFLYLDNQGLWTFEGVEMSSNAARSGSGNGNGGALWAGNGTELVFDGANSVFNYNTAATNGGAIYGSGSRLSFIGSAINFGNNKSVGGTGGAGGALWLGNGTELVFEGVNAVFNYNSAGTNGGAIYNGNSNVSFAASTVTFSTNTSSSGSGGAIYAYYSTTTFTDANVTFGGNTATNYSGGAIYSYYSTMTFTNANIMFGGNTAKNYGGAIYVYYSTMTFTDANVTFDGNTTTSFGGGAIFNDSSNISFAGNTVNFSGNNSVAGYGGAIGNSNNSTITFTDTDIAFDGNNAGGDGGAVYNANNSNISFTGSTVTFSSNTAVGSGGAIAGYNGSAITFTNADVIFGGNTANNGGAVLNYNNSAITFINANITFGGNKAYSDGGAMYNYLTDQIFTGSTVTFSGNTAENNGGAVFNTVSTMTFTGTNAIFSGNTATNGYGGALYISSGAVIFNTDGAEVLFTGNTASGKPNDVYLDIGGKLNISGSNAIRFEDGILSETSGSGIEINKSGSGAIYLGGDSEVWGDFNISGGDIVMLADATYKGKGLDLGSISALDMHNGTVNTVEVDGNFKSMTDLKMDIFSNGTNDEIKAGSADIGGNIDIFAGVGPYYHEEYDLIITSNNLNGVFASSSVIATDSSRLVYELKYENGIVKLILDGVNVADFTDLKPLTYNQSETSKAFKKISENPGNWAQILNTMLVKQNSGTDADIAAIKDFLARTSGYFLANAIRNMAADSPNNEVYDKIRNHIEEHKTNNGLWVQLRGGLESFKKDENSLEDYNDTSYGVMFGLDRFLADKMLGGDVMWGIYGRVNKDNIEQGQSKADGTKTGLGLYGGYIRDAWELKAMLLGEYDAVSTERADYAGEAAKADINGVTVSADIEAALKIWLDDNTHFRPYAGVEAANTSYGGFKESGGGIYDLDTQSGNYLRTAGRVGLGFDYEKGIWIWYANVEGKYIFDGTKPEITSQFADTGIDFNSRGAEEGRIQIGAGLGGEVRIAENWKLFANGKYYAAERYENLYGNIGVRYLFGKKNSEKKEAARSPKCRCCPECKCDGKCCAKKEKEAKEACVAPAAETAVTAAPETPSKIEEVKAPEEMPENKAISDEEMAKQKVEAEERRNRPMLKTYTLTTRFKTNNAELTAEFKEQIDEIVGELNRYDYKKITIEGHTDNTGSKEWNKILSRNRARSVYVEFINAGIPAEKIIYEGFADTMPVKSNKTAEGRAANRRTEVFVE